MSFVPNKNANEVAKDLVDNMKKSIMIDDMYLKCKDNSGICLKLKVGEWYYVSESIFSFHVTKEKGSYDYLVNQIKNYDYNCLFTKDDRYQNHSYKFFNTKEELRKIKIRKILDDE